MAAVTDQDVRAWIGRTHDDPPGDVVVDRGAIENWCVATENANPLFWDEKAAEEITGGAIAPPTMLSVWMRPHVWSPGRAEPGRPLELHFHLKEALGLPEGIVLGNEMEFREPVRLGDRIRTRQRIRDISEVRTNRLGTGRSWTIDVTYMNQRGEVVGVEPYVMFGYRR